MLLCFTFESFLNAVDFYCLGNPKVRGKGNTNVSCLLTGLLWLMSQKPAYLGLPSLLVNLQLPKRKLDARG